MSYKSTRLLIEAINTKVSGLRHHLGSAEPSSSVGAAQDAVVELRGLLNELGAKALRTTIEDVAELPPAEYVAAMKPLVRTYHQQLMLIDLLAPCLCEDLRVDACVVFLVGSDKTLVRTAHDPSKPEAERAAEMILAALDSGMREHPVPPSGAERELLEQADRVGWDTPEGEELRTRAKAAREDRDAPGLLEEAERVGFPPDEVRRESNALLDEYDLEDEDPDLGGEQ